jgi:Sulfotransferase domain
VEGTNRTSAVSSGASDEASAGDGKPSRAAGHTEGPAWSTDRHLARQARTGLERSARRIARRSLVRAAQPTYRLRMLPGFLIVGAQRAGTTSLFSVLAQHPAIFSPIRNRKELHFFDNEYDRGLKWYQSQFPIRARARMAVRGTGVQPVAFEGSPYYMFHPLVPGRIHRDLPGVRLIVMVRDPVERAYSQHAHQVGLGLESEPFERALEMEESRIDGEAEKLAADPAYNSRAYWLYAYRTRGHYADQLERMEKIFGRDRIHVIDSGDFFASPGPDYERVLDFLGLPNLGQPVFTPQNARPRSPMPQTLQAALDEHFRPHDERLAAWLGRVPSWRR